VGFVENLIYLVTMQSRFTFDKVIINYVMCCILWTTVYFAFGHSCSQYCYESWNICFCVV